MLPPVRASLRSFSRIVPLVVLLALVSAKAWCQRALIVTTQQAVPSVASNRVGTHAFTDLVCAGLPFDVRTYGTFLTMDMSPYDVIILNGHTSPTPASQVSARCQTLMAAGKKVFINGYLPFRCYDSAGQTYVEDYYADELFAANKGSSYVVTGTPTLPASIEKDPEISAVGVSNVSVGTFSLGDPAPIEIRLAGKLIGFLGPTGGALRGLSDYEYNLLDYGKVVNYLRYGDPMIVGFANDRDEGVPIVAFHTDCHDPSNPEAVDALLDLSAAHDLPLDNTLVYNEVDSAGISLWNAITDPLMAIGSHSRTHPQDWPPVTDLDSESRQVIADQQVIIPATINFFSFSGNKNPTAAQLDQLVQWGVLFDGQGQGVRAYDAPDGQHREYQVMPINTGWLRNLAQCQTTPTWPSETLYSDNVVRNNRDKYDEVMAEQHGQNVKYGIYSYGYVHDTFVNPHTSDLVEGELMSTYINRAMRWFHDQGVRFMFPHELLPRLQDYVAGSISYVSNPDDSITVTVGRPNHLSNEIKVGFKGCLTPVADAGGSVLSQQLAGNCLYVKLAAETSSTVRVAFSLLPPVTPVVTYAGSHISNATEITWREPANASAIAEYQYALGTTPSGTDALDWTSSGTLTSGSLSEAQIQDGETYYVSVRARYPEGDWSDAGVSDALVADLTRPSRPVVIDDGDEQDYADSLHAVWSSSDAQSGIVKYAYAIGVSPGDTSVLDWTETTDTEAYEYQLSLEIGQTYYVSVKARNGAGEWSETGASDGMLIIAPHPITIGEARRRPDGVFVWLADCVVTATQEDGFYVEATDRSAGIRVWTGETANLGDRLIIRGNMASDGVQRSVVVDPTNAIEFDGTVTIKPVIMPNRSLGGAGDSLVPGPDDGAGINNVGLLVTTLGIVTETGDDYIYIDDGSWIDAGEGRIGVRVSLTSPHDLEAGDYVKATGISLLHWDGLCLRRMVLTRSNDDVVALDP